MTDHITVISHHVTKLDLSVTWRDMAVIWHDANRRQRGLLTVRFSGKDAGMTWMMQKETVKGEFYLVRFLSGAKLLHFGAFKSRFEPPERPVLLPIPGNSHTPDPMRSVAFVASSDYV